MAENLIYATEKTLREAGEKIPADIKQDIEAKIETLKKAKEGNNVAEIKNNTNELSLAIQKIGAELYRKAQEEKKEEGGPSTEEGKYKEKP